MPTPPLPPAVADFLTRPHHATVSTVRRDGHPVSVPTWYLYEGGRVLLNMDEGRVRLQHLRRDPRVSLSAMDPQDWITHVSLLGRVVELVPDEGLADIDRLSHHYGGRPYPVRDRARVSAWVEVDRWHGWGRLKDA